MKHANHSSQADRLRRIEGQVKGILRMVEDQRYCIDILTQMRAVRAALRKVEERVLKEHVEHCVVQAVQGEDPLDRQQKIDELLDVVSRFSSR